MNQDDALQMYFQKLEPLRKKGCDSVLVRPSLLKEEYTPLNFQRAMIVHMLLMPRFLNSEDTGLGKTYETIFTYAYLLERYPKLKCIIASPKSAVIQWGKEFAKFSTIKTDFTGSNYKKFKSPVDARTAQYENFKANVLITTYGVLRKDYQQIIDNFKPFILVTDEATAYKGYGTTLYKAVELLSQNADRAYPLTATPIKSRADELYSIIKVLIPDLFTTKEKFQEDYCVIKKLKIRRGRMTITVPKVIGYKNLNHLRERVRPYVWGHLAEEVSDELPELIFKDVPIELTGKQKQKYHEAEVGLLTIPPQLDKILKNEGLVDLSMALKKMLYLQLIIDAPRLVELDFPSEKELELKRLILDELAGEKVVVYSRFRSVIDYLQEIFEAEDVNVLKITGEIYSAQKREEIKEQFQTSKDHNLIFLNEAGNEAINLQQARFLIFYDFPWSAGSYIQTVGRIKRIGSPHSKAVVLHLMAENSVDGDIKVVLEKKKDLILAVLKGNKDYLVSSENTLVEILREFKVRVKC